MVRRLLILLGALALVSSDSLAATPGSIELTCDVDRTQFRSAAKPLPSGDSVMFHLYPTPTGGSEIAGSPYSVPLSDLIVLKAYTEKYDSVSKRKAARINARIGSDANPVVLPVDGIAWLDLTVGAATLGCDHAATGSAISRRRVQSVAFAREAEHSETCETCTSTTDISVSAYASGTVSVPDGGYFTVPFDLEYYDTDNIHDNVTDNGKFVAPDDGKYLVTAFVGFATNSTGIREVIMFDSTGRFFGQVITGASPVQETIMTTSAIIDLSAAQYISLVVTQNSGAPLDLYSGRKLQVQKLN
jgi:hypothetical protein